MYSPAVIIGEKIPTGRTGPRRAADKCIYYTAPQNVPKSSVDLNRPPQMNDCCHWQRVVMFLINIFRIIQAIRSLN